MASVLMPNEDSPRAVPEATETPAPKIGEETGSGYIALKYTFFTPKRGDLCGAFCLIFEGETGDTVFQSLWATRADSLATLKTSQDWRTFNKLTSNIGPYDKTWGDKLVPLLSELLPVADRIDLYQASPESLSRVLSQIEGAIRKGYERATHYFLDSSCDIERLTRQDLVSAGLLDGDSDTDAPVQAAEAEVEKSFSGLLIQCLPIVDPVHGKAASGLEPGDVLEVQIQSNVGAGGLVQQFLQATKQPPLFPVELVEKRGDKTYVYLTINEEMRGLLTLTKDLRLKTKYTPPPNTSQPLLLDNLIFFLSLGLAAAGLVLAIRYLF